ncbi:MAG: hypothetical protein JW843_04015, partial [Candidatus Aminicenantes bacterium]|nr:hypothetical protein [Candidatus Aminicenantes bacterium]
MNRSHRIFGLTVILFAVFSMITAAQAQDKINEELAGDYALELGDRTLPFAIVLKDGKLFFDAQIPGGAPEPMNPVPDQPLSYKSIDPNGDEVVFVFKMNDQKKITGCTVSVPVQGIAAEA